MRNLTEAELKVQGARCGCKGSDDYCVCQNVPDAITQKEWGLTPRGSIPTTYFNLLDLLQNIADPARDPNMDIADGVTMMDYWRRDAKQLLPLVKDGQIVVDEQFGALMHAALVKAQTLRSLRQEYRSRSANFPSMEKVPYAQEAAEIIEALIEAIKTKASRNA